MISDERSDNSDSSDERSDNSGFSEGLKWQKSGKKINEKIKVN